MGASSIHKGFGPMLGAAGALFGAYIYTGLKTPMPGRDQEVAGGLTVERHEFKTPDGLTLRLKRYSNPQGTPVLFCHGFNGNGFEFDLPIEDHNIAVYLAREGYDVWISSWRGCGPEPFDCEAGDWKHSMDHLAIYDAPTLVDGVTGVTGKKPFWIGHSMGGMVLYMYLQGVRFDGEWKVVSDPDLVAEHNKKLIAGIPIASPPAFWWPRRSIYGAFASSSYGQRLLSRYVWRLRFTSLFKSRMRIGAPIRKLGNHPRVLMALAMGPLGLAIYRRKNVDKDTATSLLKWAGDDVSYRMSVQLFDGIRRGRVLQYFPFFHEEEPYDYTRNMPLITLPMFCVTGDKDYADAESIRRYCHERISSEKKKYVKMPGYGHTDLVMGRNVAQDVYPLILEWMRESEGE